MCISLSITIELGPVILSCYLFTQCDKLQLLFVGELNSKYSPLKCVCSHTTLVFYSGTPQPHPLECLAVSNPRLIWAAYRDTVKAFSRGQEVTCFHGHKGNVHTLLPFGEHLVSIDDQNCLKIWAIKTKGSYLHIPMWWRYSLFTSLQSCMESCTLTLNHSPSHVRSTPAHT